MSKLKSAENVRGERKCRLSRRALWNLFQKRYSGRGYSRTILGRMFRKRYPILCVGKNAGRLLRAEVKPRAKKRRARKPVRRKRARSSSR
jgi:hypothetical protein